MRSTLAGTASGIQPWQLAADTKKQSSQAGANRQRGVLPEQPACSEVKPQPHLSNATSCLQLRGSKAAASRAGASRQQGSDHGDECSQPNTAAAMGSNRPREKYYAAREANDYNQPVCRGSQCQRVNKENMNNCALHQYLPVLAIAATRPTCKYSAVQQL
eukprot:GHRR01032661.1.p1 GENE.GHRR01032661.1~~GHRR01032661.1.p1  ORF type:complete len:160 (-),score=51.15 GHRR01032661.1:139-618(-)